MAYLIIISKNNPIDLREISDFGKKVLSVESLSAFGLNASRYELSMELTNPVILYIRERLSKFENDFIYLKNLIDTKQKSLFVFNIDMMINVQELIDELAKNYKVYDKFSEISGLFHQGRLMFQEALIEKCKLLEGLSIQALEEVRQNIRLSSEFVDILGFIRSQNSLIGMFSDGFLSFLKPLTESHKIDFFVANEFEVNEDRLTGRLKNPITNKLKKLDTLVQLRDSNQIEKCQTLATGDCVNDVLFLNEAGIGLGYRTKHGLKENLVNWLDYCPMTAVSFIYR